MHNFKERVDNLVDKNVFHSSKVTIQGYGSFIKKKNKLHSFESIAEGIIKESILPTKEISVSKFIKGIQIYLQALYISKDNTYDFGKNHRRIIKHIDFLLKVFREKSVVSPLKGVLKWTIFNLKLQCLFGEINILDTSNKLKILEYLMNEIKGLAFLFHSKEIENYTIVGINNFEEVFRKKLMDIDEKFINTFV